MNAVPMNELFINEGRMIIGINIGEQETLGFICYGMKSQ